MFCPLLSLCPLTARGATAGLPLPPFQKDPQTGSRAQRQGHYVVNRLKKELAAGSSWAGGGGTVLPRYLLLCYPQKEDSVSHGREASTS